MCFIQHRVNSIHQLQSMPPGLGAEVDVRYHCNSLVLEHDPFHHHERAPTSLEAWLENWSNRGPLVLNVKTEGVEETCIDLMNRFSVRNWFFLDLSPPKLVKYGMFAQRGALAGLSPENLAVRFSEWEPLSSALMLNGLAGWVWVDCFTQMPLDEAAALRLRHSGFRICIVSPELQHHPLERIAEFRAQLKGIAVDAICTKRPDLWLEPSGTGSEAIA